MGLRRVGRVGVVLILMVWAVPGYSAVSPRYNLIDLGTLGGDTSWACGINDSGQVVGTSFNKDGVECGFLWSNGEMTNLGEDCLAYKINNQGQILGYNTIIENFIWDNDVFIPLGGYLAFELNDLGEAVGFKKYDQEYYATLWQGDQIINLGVLEVHSGPSFAMSINNNTKIVGYSWTIGGSCQAFLWEDGTMTALGGDLETAQDINDAGQIIGTLVTMIGEEYQRHGYLLDDGTLTDLGDVGLYMINNSGQILGGRTVGIQEYDGYVEHIPILWQDGVAYDLIDLIANDTGWELKRGEDINNLGQIVGNGYINGEYHGFLLDPIPEPAAVLLLELGSFVLLKRRRR